MFDTNDDSNTDDTEPRLYDFPATDDASSRTRSRDGRVDEDEPSSKHRSDGLRPSSTAALEIADGDELVIYEPENCTAWIQANHAVALAEQV